MLRITPTLLIDRPAMRAGTQRIREQLNAVERESVRRNETRAYDGLGTDINTYTWRGLSFARKRAVIELLMTIP